MAKINMGNSTDAQAAADMVGRCRTALIANSGPGYPAKGLILASGKTWDGTKNLGWADALEDDSAAGTFSFFGVADNGVYVKHISTNIVYKVPTDPAFYIWNSPNTTYYQRERDTLNALHAAGKTWLVDYWPYDAQGVIAMEPFTWLVASGHTTSVSGSGSDIRHTFGDVYGTTAEYVGMKAANVIFSADHCGLRDDGQLILIGASVGLLSDNRVANW